MKKLGEETITKFKDMQIIQRNDFQNFTLDSVLLANFVKINRKTKKILDIGTGCGIISLILAKRSKAEITAIEIQEVMADIAKRNILNNEVDDSVKTINDDIKNYKKLFKKDEFDTIVTNPPYFEFSGDVNQINDLSQMAKARHNIDLTLEEIIEISSFLLKNNGSFNMVFRVDRLVEVLGLFVKYRLEPKRIQYVYTKRSFYELNVDINIRSYNNLDAKICLIEGIKNAAKGLKIEYPIFVYDEKGKKSEYVKGLYE